MSGLSEMQRNHTTNGIDVTQEAARPSSPAPNHGTHVADVDSMDYNEPVATWRQRTGIDPSKQIKLVKLVHMRYQHPDLDVITTFLRHFGMHVVKRTDTQVWYRGYGPDAYVYYAQKGEKKFLGGTFEVESADEIEKYEIFPTCWKPDAHKRSGPPKWKAPRKSRIWPKHLAEAVWSRFLILKGFRSTLYMDKHLHTWANCHKN